MLLKSIKRIIKPYKSKIENKTIKYYRRRNLVDKNISIISNNCWGGFIAQYFGLQYNSPFAGLFLFSKDYLKLLKKLKYYMGLELKFINREESRYFEEVIKNEPEKIYLIGLLDDIEIHFLHYSTAEEAKDKWDKRKKRINYDNLIVKYSDRDLATEKDVKEFSELGFSKKLILTTNQYSYDFCVKLRNKDGLYINDEWKNFCETVDITDFINNYWQTKNISNQPNK